MEGGNINDLLKEIREIRENMATKEDIRKIEEKEIREIRENMATKEDIRNIEEDIRNIKEKMEWLDFKFNTFRDVLSVSPTTRQRRHRNLSPPLCPAEDGINSTRVTKHYESIL